MSESQDGQRSKLIGIGFFALILFAVLGISIFFVGRVAGKYVSAIDAAIVADDWQSARETDDKLSYYVKTSMFGQPQLFMTRARYHALVQRQYLVDMDRFYEALDRAADEILLNQDHEAAKNHLKTAFRVVKKYRGRKFSDGKPFISSGDYMLTFGLIECLRANHEPQKE